MRHLMVIRYGGFGDMVLSMAAFRSIRAHHKADRITALTTRPFAELLARSGYFDDILVDDRHKFSQLAGWLRLARELRGRRFDRIYDLQRNQRSAILYRAIGAGRRIEWSGTVHGCSHFVRDDPADYRHIVDRLSEQLTIAGIAEPLPPEFGWLSGDLARLQLPRPYALIVPGGAPHRPKKRAPAPSFAGLGRHLLSRGVTPVLIGTADERAQIEAIVAGCAGAIDLCGRTSFGDIADLARHAVGAVGNDTGAMHLAAAVGCSSLVLFSAASDPRRVAPRGRLVEVLRSDPLDALETRSLIDAWQRLCDGRQAEAPPSMRII